MKRQMSIYYECCKDCGNEDGEILFDVKDVSFMKAFSCGFKDHHGLTFLVMWDVT